MLLLVLHVSLVLVVAPEVARFPARALSLTESINVTTGGVTTANRPHCCRKARRSLFDHSLWRAICSPEFTPEIGSP
jgi:hypothetical protein